MSIWDSDDLGIIAQRVSWALFAVAACKFASFHHEHTPRRAGPTCLLDAYVYAYA